MSSSARPVHPEDVTTATLNDTPQWIASLGRTRATSTERKLVRRIMGASPTEAPWIFDATGGGVELEFEEIGSIFICDDDIRVVPLSDRHEGHLAQIVKKARKG